jgi:hypothetical protein
MSMRVLRKLSLLGIVACAAMAQPAIAQPAASGPHPLIGIADENLDMFSDPRFLQLGIRQVRFYMSWDVLSSVYKSHYRRNTLNSWLDDARALGLTPLITIDHSDLGRRQAERLPSVTQYSRAFLAFRKRYPWVTEFATWNEANYYGEATAPHPKRVAQYYLALRRDCPRCTILAAELLDIDNPKQAVPMLKWVRAFIHYAHTQPAYWGLHNYVSANKLSAVSTEQLLAVVKGDVWLTETGGILRFPHHGNPGFAMTDAHQAKVVNFLLNTLPSVSPRIQRIYLYEWRAPVKRTAWDSSLITYNNRPRAAFEVLASTLENWGIPPNCASLTFPPPCTSTTGTTGTTTP